MILLIIIGSYIAHIFLCRYLNVWALNNDNSKGGVEIIPQIWFIPVFGFLGTMVFVIAVLYQKWEKTPSHKWFLNKKD